jgi:hypothetical protein
LKDATGSTNTNYSSLPYYPNFNSAGIIIYEESKEIFADSVIYNPSDSDVKNRFSPGKSYWLAGFVGFSAVIRNSFYLIRQGEKNCIYFPYQ